MIVQGEIIPEPKQPFFIVYNYRTSPTNPYASPKKHRIKKSVIPTPRTTPKRCRKSPTNISDPFALPQPCPSQAKTLGTPEQIISEEKSQQSSQKMAVLQMEHVSERSDMREYSVHEESDLEKGIPVQVHEVELDEGSAIENSTFRNTYLFDHPMDPTLKTSHSSP